MSTKEKELEAKAIAAGILKKRKRGRPGGNPDLVKFQFQPKGDAARTKTLGWKVTPKQFSAARNIPDLNDRFLKWLEEMIG